MIACYHLHLEHPRGRGALLDDVSFEIPQGSWAEITGEPGCGKSILFELLSLRARPRQGTLIVAGRNLARLPRRKLAALRRRVGTCAQRARLLEGRSVVENLLVPLVARGSTRGAAAQVEEALERLDLQEVRELSAEALTRSERRAVAILRACIGQPELVVVDGGLEDLDGVWRKRVRRHLRQLHRQGGTVVLLGREVVGPMTGQGLVFRLEDGALEPLERSHHQPGPELVGRRR